MIENIRQVLEMFLEELYQLYNIQRVYKVKRLVLACMSLEPSFYKWMTVAIFNPSIFLKKYLFNYLTDFTIGKRFIMNTRHHSQF